MSFFSRRANKPKPFIPVYNSNSFQESTESLKIETTEEVEPVQAIEVPQEVPPVEQEEKELITIELTGEQPIEPEET